MSIGFYADVSVIPIHLFDMANDDMLDAVSTRHCQQLYSQTRVANTQHTPSSIAFAIGRRHATEPNDISELATVTQKRKKKIQTFLYDSYNMQKA